MTEQKSSDLLKKLPGYALRRAANATMADLAERLAAVGLRITEATILLLIDDRSELTASEIGKLLDIQRANMVPLLSRMEGAGLIHRKPLNGKSMAVVLTPAGIKKRGKVQELTDAFEIELMEKVPEEHRQHLLPALYALWPGSSG